MLFLGHSSTPFVKLILRTHLAYLTEVFQLDARSVDRYWFYLKYLLLWADAILLGEIMSVRPTFAAFLATSRLDGTRDPLSSATLKKIIQLAKRFLTWAKMTHPRAFRAMPVAWIEALRPPRSVEQTTEHEFVTLDEVLQLSTLRIDEDDLALCRD